MVEEPGRSSVSTYERDLYGKGLANMTEDGFIPNFEGPPEAELFDCGYCGKPILTLWAPNHCGMIRSGAYCLMGDEVWHTRCVDECLIKHPIDMGLDEGET